MPCSLVAHTLFVSRHDHGHNCCGHAGTHLRLGKRRLMQRRTFFSFHYTPDASRAAQVRNMGMVDGNNPVSDNDWETITSGGAAAIKKWIADQMHGRSCTVVLVGSDTAYRPMIKHEIIQSWNDRMGVVGIHIYGLKNWTAKSQRRAETRSTTSRTGRVERSSRQSCAVTPRRGTTSKSDTPGLRSTWPTRSKRRLKYDRKISRTK